MIIRYPCIIKEFEVESKLKGSAIVIYGTGEDAKLFFMRHYSHINIDFFFSKDNKDNFCGIDSYSVEVALEKISTQTIVICSRRFSPKMKKELEKNGKEAGKDFYIWDPCYTYSVKKLVAYFKDKIEINNGEKKLLIPIEDCHDGNIILYSYIVPIIAKKNNASIIGYIRNSGNRFESTIYPSVFDLYESIGMKDVINIPQTRYSNNKIQDTYKNIIKNIHNMDDWENIEIDGMKCGISFLRDYLRKYELDFDPLNKDALECLLDDIKIVVFWNEYFKKNEVVCTILWDGVHNESFLRDISLNYNVKTYIIHRQAISNTFLNFHYGEDYDCLKNYFDLLSETDKKIGIEWGKKCVEKLMSGAETDNPYRKNLDNVFSYADSNYSFGEKKSLRVVICPHIFNEDQWLNGSQICSNNYISWLLFVGEISLYTDYEWYLKIHPDEKERGKKLINNYLKKYPNIKMIPANISPLVLRNNGFDYALTIAGSIGHEYPLIGINVVNAGNNPHQSFGFNINPQNREEYKRILLNLKEYDVLNNKDEIYEYYGIYYLYYQANEYSKIINDSFYFFAPFDVDYDNSMYQRYLKGICDSNERKVIDAINRILDLLENRKIGNYYRKDESEILNKIDMFKGL